MIDSKYSYFSPLILSWKLSQAFVDAYSIYLGIVFDPSSGQNLKELEKTVRTRIQTMFDERFRHEDFINALSDTIAVFSDFAKYTGSSQIYQNFSNLFSIWNNTLMEPIRDTYWRTPSHKICEIEKYSLFRYDRATVDRRNSSAGDIQTPLLIVYSFINRHYILDLLPEVSIVRSFLKQGFDIFATEWGTPGPYDRELTIGHFVNEYMDKSVDFIRNITKSDKVSILGYCWGGNLVLSYAALHPEKVKNILTIATPGDAQADDVILSVWTKRMNVDALLDAFGNVPSTLLNAAFALRSPIEYLHKYPHFFEEAHDFESMLEFFATETWLQDSLPVIGEIFREFVKCYYQQNLLIRNQMRIDGAEIDLSKISAPFLNVVASRDDLVAPASSKALNDVVGSNDKSLIEHHSGHVGLIIGERAHKEVWPTVGKWLRERS